MSDYIDNLVARSLGLAEVIRPRPLSLFEPAPPALVAADQFEIRQVGELGDSTFEAGDLKVQTASLKDRPVPPRPAAGPQEKPFSSHTEPHSDSRPQHNNRASDSRPGTSAPLLIPDAPALFKPGADATIQEGPDQPHHAADSHQAVSERARLGVSVRLTASPSDQSTIAQEASLLNPFRSSAPEPAIATPESLVLAPPLRTLLITPAVTPMSAGDHEPESHSTGRAAPVTAAHDARAETAHTITIRIGRVDVRAVMQERSEKRRASERRSPALSLDQYLKQRSGGKS